VEIGFGSGRRACLLLERCAPARYRCFEPDRSRAQSGIHDLSRWPDRARIEWQEPENPLPLDSSAFDLFLTVNCFERLRMDQLYMVCHEAKRVLRTGGLWLLAGLTWGPSRQEKVQGKIATMLYKRRPLDLTHYISPEDWETVAEKRFPAGCFQWQVLALRRIESPAAEPLS
jgi:Methyltransferase domain